MFNKSSYRTDLGASPPGVTAITPNLFAINYNDGIQFVAGIVAYADGTIHTNSVDGENNVRNKTKIIMDNIKSIMDPRGYSLHGELKVSVFMTDIDFYSVFNEVYETYLSGEAKPPVRETIQVAGLPGAKRDAPVIIEVSVIAG